MHEYANLVINSFNDDQRLRASTVKDGPAFYHNLEKVLDSQRQKHFVMGLLPRGDSSVLDFTSSDMLSLARTGRVRDAFLSELAKHPDFSLGAAGSRTQNNYDYIAQVEADIARFHGVDTVFITPSGFAANVGVLSAVPLPGDAIVYDELVHASTHEGFKASLAQYVVPFKHNDQESLREVLVDLKGKDEGFQQGTRSILICVESIYSMDGDFCPLKELVQSVKDEFPHGNAQFVVDEAHSLGVIGDEGKGLVSMLGLEKEIAIQVHVSSKALGGTGGLIMCNETIRSMLLNYARSVIFSAAPPFPTAASIIAGYRFLMSGETREAQETIQRNVNYFVESITSKPIWDEAVDESLLWIPVLEGWEQRSFQTHIIPLRTQPRHELFLYFHLLSENINAHPIAFPIVPKGASRVRLVFHAHNKLEQIDTLVSAICDWVEEMLQIQRGESEWKIPKAARLAFAKQSAPDR